MSLQVVYKNYWRTGILGTPGTEHPQFPRTDTQIDTLKQGWRSRYGAGSGNGYFVVAPDNKYIDFTEFLGTVITDGGMETWASSTDLTNWTETVIGASIINRESTTKHDGSYSCRIDVDSSNNQSYFYQSVTMIAATTYKLIIWYKNSESGKTAKFKFLDSGVNQHLQSNGSWAAPETYIVLPNSTVWAKYELVFPSHASYTSYVLFLRVDSAASSSIYFDDVSICQVFTATLTTGTYSGQTLVAEMKTQLDIQGALTYTVSYDEITAYFSIVGSGDYELLWYTGPHKATDISGLCGYSDATDDLGSYTCTSDYRRIHSLEYSGKNDVGSMVEVDYVALIGHNLTSAAVITLYSADDTSGTNQVEDIIAWAAGDIWFTLPAARTKRVYQITIADPLNAASYVEVKTIVVGKVRALNRLHGAQYEHGPEDFSTGQLSDSLVQFGEDKPTPDSWGLSFKGLNDTSIAYAKALIEECQKVHGFIICLDSTTPATNTFFVVNTAIARPARQHTDYWNWAMAIREVV